MTTVTVPVLGENGTPNTEATVSRAARALEGSDATLAADMALTVDCAAAMRLSMAPSSFLLCCDALSFPVVKAETTDWADGAPVAELDPDAEPSAAAIRKSTAAVWFWGQVRTARYQPGAKAIGTPTTFPFWEIAVMPFALKFGTHFYRSWR
jgi:hypothetical protein